MSYGTHPYPYPDHAPTPRTGIVRSPRSLRNRFGVSARQYRKAQKGMRRNAPRLPDIQRALSKLWDEIARGERVDVTGVAVRL